MSSEWILTGGRVIDPSRGVDGYHDVCIKDGRIASESELSSPVRLDMSGKVLAPGFIDVHVHLREPGQTHKDDIATGTAAAKAGGFTTIVAMPNTIPAPDTPEHVEAILALIAQKACVRVALAGALTLGREGMTETDAAALRKAGCPLLSDDGSTPQSAGLMKRIMIAVAEAGLPVVDHCEDMSLSKPGLLHDGSVARKLGLPGQPRSAEELIVARDLLLAGETGCHIHLQHLSSAGSVDLIRWAKDRGIKVTAETTPHHLCLTHEACLEFGTNAKMAPPLREEEDRLALIRGIEDGTIDMIATDHAPHTTQEKNQEWSKAPFGIVGLETAVPLCLDRLVHTGCMSIAKLIERFTTGPAKLLGNLGVDLATLKIGAPAEITILDLDATHTVNVADFASKSTNCPYDGLVLKGKVVKTIMGNCR